MTVVSVTYGSRWSFLRSVLIELTQRATAVGRVIVVDNCADYDVGQAVANERLPRVRVSRLNRNTGSAAGFAHGIQCAIETDCQFIWLLDDDNQPAPDSLERLLHAYRMLGAVPDNTLLSLRRNQTENVGALSGERRIWVRPNSFMGFHLVEFPARLLRRLSKKKASALLSPLVPVGYAPYGGWLFHRSWVDRIGLPDSRLYLYGDDHEYTARVVANGGKIYLCGTSEVVDLETSWHYVKACAPALIASTSSVRRLFYMLRNRVYWERRGFVTSTVVYGANAAIFLALLTLRGLVCERNPMFVIRRLKLLARAIRDGWSARLGEVVVE